MATDKRIIKTKTALKSALLSLLKIQPMNTISISKLCNTARVDRNTFYCHYNIPEDILKEVLEEHKHTILNEINKTAPHYNYKDMLLRICDYMYQTKELSVLFFINLSGFSYLQHITDASNEHILNIFQKNKVNLNFNELQTINRYATGGTTLLIQDWVLSGMKEPPEQIADKLNELNTFVLNHYFKV